jgi:hypothetical protein
MKVTVYLRDTIECFDDHWYRIEPDFLLLIYESKDGDGRGPVAAFREWSYVIKK